MNFKIINSKDLKKECWDPRRFFGKCHDCKRYRFCKVKVINKKYEKLLANVRKAKEELKKWRRENG